MSEIIGPIISTLPARVLNIIISPGGRGPLGLPSDQSGEFPDLIGIDLPLIYIALFSLYIVIPTLV